MNEQRIAADRTAVVTIARGRGEHLRHQLRSLTAQRSGLGHFVLVAMGDPGLATVLSNERPPAREVLMRELAVPTSAGGVLDLPLAEARNLGARTAIDAGAEALVFLDVDCVASDGLVDRYAEVLGSLDPSEPAAVCGGVGYLPADADPAELGTADLAALARPHPARPLIAADCVQESTRLDLFWSLSFAMTARSWETVGGFCVDYVGYGGEDTDFAQQLGSAGGSLWWAGGADAYHQHHGSTTPPVQHLAAIVRNANLFHQRWGWFPMTGWLAEFERLGLAEPAPDGRSWRVTRTDGGR